MKYLVTVLAVALLGSSSSLEAMTPKEAAQIFSQFAKLKPPFSAASAGRVFGSAKWVDSVEIRHITVLAGEMHLSLHLGGEAFVITLIRGPRLTDDWWIEVRVTNDVGSEIALRDFLHGKASPRARIVEYSCVTYGKVERSGGDNRVPDTLQQ